MKRILPRLTISMAIILILGTFALPSGAAQAVSTSPRRLPVVTVPVASLKLPGNAISSLHTDHDGSCDAYPDNSGDVCFWYSTSPTGSSMVDLWAGYPDMTQQTFITPGTGQGVTANNAGFLLNINGSTAVRLHSGKNYTGNYIEIGGGQAAVVNWFHFLSFSVVPDPNWI